MRIDSSPTGFIAPHDPEELAVLYHASPLQGLTRLVPRVSTHGHAWVYATDSFFLASLFLGRLGGDLTCQIGSRGGKPYVEEQFAGAFDLRYGTVAASLYVVSADGFVSGRTAWRGDWVSEQAVIPRQEITIADVRAHLLQLVAEGRLELRRYAAKTTDAAAEEAELVERFARLHTKGGERIFRHLDDYYPHLTERVRSRVAAIDFIAGKIR